MKYQKRNEQKPIECSGRYISTWLWVRKCIRDYMGSSGSMCMECMRMRFPNDTRQLGTRMHRMFAAFRILLSFVAAAAECSIFKMCLWAVILCVSEKKYLFFASFYFPMLRTWRNEIEKTLLFKASGIWLTAIPVFSLLVRLFEQNLPEFSLQLFV